MFYYIMNRSSRKQKEEKTGGKTKTPVPDLDVFIDQFVRKLFTKITVMQN